MLRITIRFSESVILTAELLAEMTHAVMVSSLYLSNAPRQAFSRRSRSVPVLAYNLAVIRNFDNSPPTGPNVRSISCPPTDSTTYGAFHKAEPNSNEILPSIRSFSGAKDLALSMIALCKLKNIPPQQCPYEPRNKPRKNIVAIELL